MTAGDVALLEALSAMSPRPVAIEALWDGDTQGWFVDLYAVIEEGGDHSSLCLERYSGGRDIRLFEGIVPPWPEAAAAARAGQQLTDALGIPFLFPSPRHPEDDCPHWWQLHRSEPCDRCSIPLLQDPKTPWLGLCFHCHLELETEAHEASWSPEERAAPRCSVCGKPAVGDAGTPPRCPCCRAQYVEFRCRSCGHRSLVSRSGAQDDICDTCKVRVRLRSLTDDERLRLRQASARSEMSGMREALALLGCGLREAQLAVWLIPTDTGSDP